MRYLNKFKDIKNDSNRIIKESYDAFIEDTKDILNHITDVGFTTSYKEYEKDLFFVRIFKVITDEEYSFDSPEFRFDEIKFDVQSYLSYMTDELGYEISFIYSISKQNSRYMRTQQTKEELINGKDLGNIKCLSIEFKK